MAAHWGSLQSCLLGVMMIDLISSTFVLTFSHVCVVAVFMIGLLCFFVRPSAFRQIAGLKLLLQSVSLGLVLTGWERHDLRLVQSMIVSTLLVEAIVIGLALTMIIRMNKHQQVAESEDMGPPGEDRNDSDA